MWDVCVLIHFVVHLILIINTDYHGSTQFWKCRSVQVWLTSSKTPCLLVFDVFSSVCVLHVPQVLSLPSSCLLYVHNIDIYSIFEPIPSFLCVHANVEMTSVVELFSDHFSFSIKSGMWTDQCCPFSAVACAACVLLIVTITQSEIQTF